MNFRVSWENESKWMQSFLVIYLICQINLTIVQFKLKWKRNTIVKMCFRLVLACDTKSFIVFECIRGNKGELFSTFGEQRKTKPFLLFLAVFFFFSSALLYACERIYCTKYPNILYTDDAYWLTLHTYILTNNRNKRERISCKED